MRPFVKFLTIICRTGRTGLCLVMPLWCPVSHSLCWPRETSVDVCVPNVTTHADRDVAKARSTLATMSKQHYRSNRQLYCLLLRQCCRFRQQCRSYVRLCRKDEISTRNSFDIVAVFGNKVERCFDIVAGVDRALRFNRDRDHDPIGATSVYSVQSVHRFQLKDRRIPPDFCDENTQLLVLFGTVDRHGDIRTLA